MIPLMSGAFTLDEEFVKKELSKFVLEAKRFSMGEKCLEFESLFAIHQKRKYCVLFNSGSSANLALLQALKNQDKLRDDDDIAVSALTWATNVMPIIQLGMHPIPLDCSLSNLNVMLEHVKQRDEDSKFTCLFITNALGFAGDLAQIRDYCIKENIIFIEDNCESLGSEVGGVKTGNFSLASTFSFYAAHHLSTIEGGAVCTDDKDLYNMLLMVRAHGWDRNLSTADAAAIGQHTNSFYKKYTFYDLAYNLRPTEITGFLGCLQIGALDATYYIRENNFRELNEVLASNEDLLPLDVDHLTKVSNFAFPVICKNKDLFNKYLAKFSKYLEVRPIISGNIQIQPFYRKYVENFWPVPNTEFIHEHGFYFANNPSLKKEDLAIIKGCLKGDI